MPMGRKSKVDLIRNNIEQIKKWKQLGATDDQIAEQLGMSRSTWYEHMKNNPDLSDAVKRGVEDFVMDLRGELARQAFKHTLVTTKVYRKVDLETKHMTEYTETTTKEVDGNIGANHLLQKNLDPENWKENWDNYEFRKKELEIRQQMADNAGF